ncbi:MAG: hypothetical protein IID34_16430 [Planctomycetes bacterium]|nr:hypothetical protein [Planctomycetota bacterium]
MKCPLCEDDAKIFQMQGYHAITEVDCARCGTFAMDRIMECNVPSSKKARAQISAITREATLKKLPILVASKSDAPSNVGSYLTIHVDEILATEFPRKLSDRIRRVLLNLANASTGLGHWIKLDGSQDNAFFFALDSREALFMVETLQKAGWIDDPRHSTKHVVHLALTSAGWIEVDEMSNRRVRDELTQGFVAMWFGNKDENYDGCPSSEFSRDAYLQGFHVGIDRAGYVARRIDFKEFNEDVVAELLMEIQQSRFLVADLTGHRNGVYFEAGYARGLGLPVIFTCHKDDLANAHFDTRNYNQLLWAEVEELAEKLENRIVATIGRGSPEASRVGTAHQSS